MPIVSQDVVDGPNIQADGERREGVIEFVFASGRVVRRSVNAPDALSWANLLIDLPAIVESAEAENDAETASDSDEEINDADLGEASRELLALAYLRKAYALDSPYDAYLKFDKFNNYRVSKGWSLTQVVAGLSSVGLTQEEWDKILPAYQYLSNAARVTAMAAYQPIAQTWDEREPL